MSLQQLTESFLDLWHHFDPIEARESDREGPPPKLPQFDAASVAQHTAAFRSLLGAVEELEIESLDEEIDRTLLVDAIRLRIHRLTHHRAERWNPALWVDRLRRSLAIGGNDPSVLATIPDWVDRLRETVSEPSRIHLHFALRDLASVRDNLASERSDRISDDLIQQVDWSLANLDSFLRNDLVPMAGDPPAIGEAEVDWHLTFAWKLGINTRDAARRLDARMASLADEAKLFGSGGSRERGPGPDADRPEGSETRRRLIPMEWPIAWEQFVQGRRSRDNPDLRRGWVRNAALGTAAARTELRVQTGEIGLAEGLETVKRLTGSTAMERDLLLTPLRLVGQALLTIQWEAMSGQPNTDPEALIEAVRSTGLFHPELIAWKIAADV